MERNEVFEKVAETINEIFDIDIDSITEDMTFESLNADSFDMLELLTHLEDVFDAEVESGNVENITTVGAAIDAILAAI